VIGRSSTARRADFGQISGSSIKAQGDAGSFGIWLLIRSRFLFPQEGFEAAS